MSADASLGKKVFAKTGEDRLYLSVAALCCTGKGFSSKNERGILKRNVWGFYLLHFQRKKSDLDCPKNLWFICNESNRASEMYLIERGNSFSQLQILFTSNAYSAQIFVWKDALVKNWTLWLMTKIFPSTPVHLSYPRNLSKAEKIYLRT